MWRRKPVIFLSGAGVLFGTACIVKDWISGSNFDTTIRADQKVVIVTGANSGIGNETVRSLAKRGAKIYMACRDMEKCEEVRKKYVLESQNKYIYCRPCDLASFDSIKKFVETFKSEQDSLDILINNAGVMRCPKSLTKEGIEMQLGVNHMGHFLLTNLLLDMLKKSAPSRVVVVSSIAHKRGKIKMDDLNSDVNYDPVEAYNQSKLANILFMNELSSLLLGTNVTVNAVHPGIVDTNIIRHMSVATSVFRYIFYPFVWPFVKSATSGSQVVLYAALDPSLEKVTGHYFSNLKEAQVSEDGQNIELAKWLWAVSEKWTRLKA